MKKRQNKKASVQKPQVVIPSNIFKGLSTYMLSEYRNRVFLSKLRLFFNLVDNAIYREDGDIEKYYNFIKCFMDTSLENGIDDTETIIDKILSTPKYEEDFTDLLNDEVIDSVDTFSPDEAIYFENEIIERLNFHSVSDDIAKMKLTISRYETGDYDSYGEIIADISVCSKNITKKIMAKSVGALDIPDINSSSDNLRSILSKVIDRMNDPKRVISSGIRRLNKMLNGGYQPGRVYIYCGISGGLIFRSR